MALYINMLLANGENPMPKKRETNNRWGLRINITKTEFTIFNRHDFPYVQLHISGGEIERITIFRVPFEWHMRSSSGNQKHNRVS